MSDILKKPTVLVLNRNWQAINVRTVAEAILQMSTEVATGLDISGDSMAPVKWADWIKLPIRENDSAIHTPNASIRVPTVIVLANYAKVPKKRPTLTPENIWKRDKGICQYTGRPLARGEGNIDHVTPRARGGATSWENCVLADRAVNSRKADKLPHEAGLHLRKKPEAPKELPVTALIRNLHGVADWEPFLKS
jgi:5-methylcytosine-specific restriction endonuclease McrA